MDERSYTGFQKTLDEQALTYLKTHGETPIAALYYVLSIGDASVSKTDVAEMAWRLAKEGRVDLKDYGVASTFNEYLKIWEMNLDIYVAVVSSLLVLLAIYGVPSEFPFVVLRWALGSVFVLFIPGYVAMVALFPRSREMNSLERLALSVGLSLALIPLVGLLLNFTPWGITLIPIIIAVTTFTLGLATIAVVRRYTSTRESRAY